MHFQRVWLAAMAGLLLGGCGAGDPEAAVFRAAKSGDVKTLQSVLAKHPEVAKAQDATIDGRKRTPLHDAANRAVAEVLVEAGADVNAKDLRGWTPLHSARSGEVAEFLIAHGASVSAKADRKVTPLHVTADVGVAAALLVGRAPLEEPADASMTPLHWQILDGHTEVVALLLERGAQTALKFFDQRTYMHVAASRNHPEIVKLLAGRGLSVNARDNLGGTPLHMAALNDHVAVAEALLALHAEPNPHLSNQAAEHTTDSYEGRLRERSLANATPLDLAKSDEMKALLQRAGGTSVFAGKLPPAVDVNAELRRQAMAADRDDRGPPRNAAPVTPRPASASAPAAPRPPPVQAKPAAAPSPAPVVAATAVENLVLRGVGGSAARRLALIHSGIKTYTLAAGDSSILQTPMGNVDLRCIEVRTNSVLVQVAGEEQPRELRMR